MTLLQESRVGLFQTKLGKDKLGLTNFTGREGISELFKFRVQCVSETQEPLELGNLLASEAHVRISSHYDRVDRFFHGRISDARVLGKDREFVRYEFVLRPAYWFLSRNSNCRIFNDKRADQIIQQVLDEHSFLKCDTSNLGTDYPQLEYCVQYRESDFAFVSRLMEENGIYYYFEHAEDQHQMVLAKGKAGLKDKQGGANLHFLASEKTVVGDGDTVNEWRPEQSFRTPKVILADYDYKKAGDAMLVDKSAPTPYDPLGLELYDYPGGFEEQGVGHELAENRLNSEVDSERVIAARGDAVTCEPGKLVNLYDHDFDSYNKQYLVRRARHSFNSNFYRAAPSPAPEYTGTYEFQSDTEHHPQIVTPKPIIAGPQTAVVSDTSLDQSRIKVQFFWDRKKSQSRWVRVSHPWADDNWGDFRIPHIGQEVIVEFINGDPDYPLVTGAVYNGQKKAPWDDHRISGTRTALTNELYFDERNKGGQKFKVHASHDLEITVDNNEKRDVERDVIVDIGGSRTETIKQSWTVEATASIEFKVGESKITMTPASIKIESPMIEIQATATLQAKAGGPVIVQGTPIMLN